MSAVVTAGETMRHQFFSMLVVVSLSAAWLSTAPAVASEPAKHVQEPIARDAAFGPYKIGMTFAQFQAVPPPPAVKGFSKVEMVKILVGTDAGCQFFGGSLPPFRFGSPTFTFNGNSGDAKLVRIAGDVDAADIASFGEKLKAQYGAPTTSTSKDGLHTAIQEWKLAGNSIDIKQNNNLIADVEYKSGSFHEQVASKWPNSGLESPQYRQTNVSSQLDTAAVPGNIDFGPYMADLQRRVKKHWFPPKGAESKRVVVRFRIHTTGALSDLLVDQSSEVTLADGAALKAVEDASPFRPLPTGAPEAIEVQFTFDYNVLGRFTGPVGSPSLYR